MKTEELEAIEKLNSQIGEKFNEVKKQLGDKVNKEDLEAAAATVEEIRALLDKLQGEVSTGDAAVEVVEEELAKRTKEIAQIEKQMKEMKEDVSIMKDRGTQGASNKSFGQQVVDAMKEADLFKTSLRKGEHRSLEVTINKTVGTMTTANVIPVGTNAIPFSLSDAESGLTRIQRRTPWILELANVSSTNKMYVQWAEQTGVEGSAAETAEGNDKSQADFDWTEKSQKVEKVTAFIKVSKEMLDDLDGLRSEIDTELRERILLQVDADLLSGDGTTPTLKGILSGDTAYSAGSFAGTIEDPNKYDVLRTAIAQVVAANFIPNYILLHPDDVASMDLAKSASDGHYVMPPFKSADGMTVSGVKIVENTGQTVDKFTVGDFSKLNVRMRENLTIDVGLDGDDFTKNLVTILGEIRLASYIKANHATAFVSGDFSDAITALATS